METNRGGLATTINKLKRPELFTGHCVEHISEPLKIGSELKCQPHTRSKTEHLISESWNEFTPVHIVPTAQQSERLDEAAKEFFKPLFLILEKTTKYLSEQIKSSTPLERLVFACLTFYGTCVLILDILER